MVRSACRLAVLAALAGGALLGTAGSAHAEPGQLTVAVRATDPLHPVVTLTNRGSTPCQVADTALGTVAFSRVEQGGAVVEPIVSYPAFDERLDSSVTGGLHDLGPGRTEQLAVPVLAGGPTGHLIETVSWSASTGPVAMLYPVRPGQPLRVDLNYDWQAEAIGTPLCGAAAAIAAPAPTAAPSTGPLIPVVQKKDAWSGWAGASLILLLLGVLLALLVLGALLMRSRRNGGVFALLLFAAAAAGTATAPPARADFTVDPRMQGAFDNCLSVYRQDGNDPAGLLPVLEAPNFHVQLGPGDEDSHELGIPGGAFVFWDPDDRRRLTGPGGNGTGPAREPCATLYHELYHAKEDAEGGRSNFECVTDGGRSGIGTGEVNATRAENALREHLGEAVRTVYGGVALPSGDCHPRQPTDRFCTESAGGPMCTCRTDGCSESTGDPHLMTFDGRRYDFQAVGEFVASRDPAGGFQVQVRQEPYPGRTDVAVNTAVAADVAGDKVQVNLVAGKLAVLVNGASRGEVAGPLPKGGALSTADSGLGTLVGIGWPDGSAFTLAPIGGFGINLTAAVAPGRGGKLEGLFGDADGVPANDIAPRGGAPLADGTTLYPRFADSWRVGDSGSLFTYAVGTGTATYTDRAFPKRTTTAASVPNRAAAEAICRQVGVREPALLEGCVLDVALTGQADFAAAAAYAQQVSPVPGAPAGLPSTADIYRCGTSPVGDLPGGSGSAPIRVRVPAGTTAITFPEVSGTIGAASQATVGPDGDPGWGGTDIPASYGLSGIRHATLALFVIGVFLPAPGSPPATADVSNAEQSADFAPGLGELFAVGDGRSAAGAQQRFAVPAGATGMCLGFADASNFKGSPGYFDDNAGAVSITYQTS
jgi:hypothetical protein